MTKELLTEFIHEGLGYSSSVMLQDYLVYYHSPSGLDVEIHLHLSLYDDIEGFRHVASIIDYQNWLVSRRNNLIKDIIE